MGATIRGSVLHFGTGRCVAADESTVLENQATVHAVQDLPRVLGYQDRAIVPGQLADHDRDVLSALRVELRGRLIQHQHIRAHDHDAGDRHALLLPT